MRCLTGADRRRRRIVPSRSQKPIGPVRVATSKKRTPEISVSVVHVGDVDVPRSAIKCELHDSNRFRPYFRLSGHIRSGSCLPVLGIAAGYAGRSVPLLQLSRFRREISGLHPIRHLSDHRQRDKLDYPVAARGALRFLGETPSVAIQNSIVELAATDGKPEEMLRTRVGGYLHDLERNEQLRSNVLRALPKITESIMPQIQRLCWVGFTRTRHALALRDDSSGPSARCTQAFSRDGACSELTEPPPFCRDGSACAGTWRGELNVADQRAGTLDDLSWTCRHSRPCFCSVGTNP